MSVPGIVQEDLGEEQVAAQVSLGGEDRLFVTPSRTLIYRGEGLLSDESVDSYPHDAERIEVKEGRRKATITLEYGIDGPRSFSVPAKRIDDALHPVVAGVLNAASVTEPGETVKHTYRFSELTIIITSDRLVKHVGQAVWDQEYEQYHYENATGLIFEEGSVATQIVLEIDGRQQRIKAPNDQAAQLREHLEEALFAYHGAADRAEFEAMMAPEEDPEPQPEADVDAAEGGDDADGGDSATPEASDDATLGGLDPLDPGRDLTDRDAPVESGGGGSGAVAAAEVEDADTTAEEAQDTEAAEEDLDAAGFESADQPEDPVQAQLADLTEAVERQNELLSKHHTTLQKLIEELRRGR